MLGPNYLLWGVGTLIPYNKVVAGLTIVAIMLAREKKSFYADRSSYLIFIFLFLAAASQFLSNASSPVGWEILDKLWKIVLLNLLVTCFMRSRVRLYSLVLTICVAVGFEAGTDGLKFLASAGSYSTLGNPVLGDNNNVALVTLMIMPMLGYVAQMSATPFVFYGARASIVLFALSVVSTNSRGGFVGLLVLVFLGMLSSRRKMSYLAAVAIVGLVFSQAAPDRWTKRMDTIETADQDSSFMGRVIAWKMSTLIALDRPLVGGGLHAVQSQNIWAAYEFGFERLSFIPTDLPSEMPRAAHSIYFEILGDTGFTGLALFLGIIACSFWNAASIRSLARGRDELLWAARLATSLRSSLIVFVVSGAGLSASYSDLNYVLFGMLTALRAVVREQVRPAGSAVRPWQRAQRPRGWLPGAQVADAGRAAAGSGAARPVTINSGVPHVGRGPIG